MHRRIFSLISVFALASCPMLLYAQDSSYARAVVNRLCAKDLAGRGYAPRGALQAGIVIDSLMKAQGLGVVKRQPYVFPVNYIKDVSLRLGGQDLQPGRDYLADAGSATENINGNIAWVVNAALLNKSVQFEKQLKKWLKKCAIPGNRFVLIDTLSVELNNKFKKELQLINQKCRVIRIVKKLTWTVATESGPCRSIDLLAGAFAGTLKAGTSVQLSLVSDYRKRQQTNIVGMVRGSLYPDSFIVICAHYDHLGMMGQAVFPGANDNAAGVAMMLDLAGHYARHPHHCSILFIAFSGEEAGLLGSLYYVQEPLYPLKKTRFVLNLDLVGTGETGMTVVNATAFPDEFRLLDSLNKSGSFLPEIRKRGKAANSDHHFFTEMGIPSFFCYQSGPRSAYHDIQDVPETLTLAGYNGTFRLFRIFLDELP